MTTGNTSGAIFSIDARRLWLYLLIGCIAIELLFFVLDWVVNHQRGSPVRAIRRMFNTAREDSIPSWFAVTQTFVVAMVAYMNHAVVRKNHGSKLRWMGWLMIAVFFLYMSVDDGAKIHERVGTMADHGQTPDSIVAAYPSYAWQVVAGPFFAVFGACILVFLWLEMAVALERCLVILAFSMFAVALGLDFLEGLEDGYSAIVDTLGWETGAVRHVAKSIEECIEMLGMSLFLSGFTHYLTHITPSVSVRFAAEP